MSEPNTSCDTHSFLRATVGHDPWIVGGDDGLSPFVASPDGRHLAGVNFEGAWFARTDNGRVTRCDATDVRASRTVLFSPDSKSLYVLGDLGIVVLRVSDGSVTRRIERLGSVERPARRR